MSLPECSVNARPRDELSLDQRGGGKVNSACVKWCVEGGYNQILCESLSRGGWEVNVMIRCA